MTSLRSFQSALSVMPFALALAACGGPSVSFTRVDTIPKPAAGSGDKDEVVKRISEGGTVVALPKTRLMLDLAPAKAAAPAAKNDKEGKEGKTEETAKAAKLPQEVITEIEHRGKIYSVVAVQAPTTNEYLVRAGKSWFEESKLIVTKYPQTNLPASIKFNYVNKTPQRLEQIGKVALTVISIASFALASASAADDLQPFVIDIDQELPLTPLPNNSGLWKYKITFEDNLAAKRDVVTRADFEKLTANGAMVGFYPAPACRDAAVTLTKLQPEKEGSAKMEDKTELTIRAKIGVPEYIKLVPLQQETVITYKDLCDATVDSKEYDGFDTFLASSKALMDAVDGVKKKLDEAKKNAK